MNECVTTTNPEQTDATKAEKERRRREEEASERLWRMRVQFEARRAVLRAGR